MVWVVILGLVVWVAWLSQRVADLRGRVERAERRTQATPAEIYPAAAEPLRPTRVTPSPVTPPPITAQPIPARVDDGEFDARPAWTPGEAKTPWMPAARDRAGAWLAENGLAWIGGGVLALGGLFMVSYAAQRGVFTPALRIATAAVVGLVLLGASEWLRRQADRETRGHRLAAAAAAGAGAATLYSATWGAYWLYGFIGLGPAGALMGVVSLGLLLLAVRHGEPLAILAIAGGMLAPVITGPERWAAPALTGYLSVLVLTGYAAAAGRRWGWAGMTTLAGAALWAVAGFAAEGYVRMVALALAPVALSIAALEWRARREAAPAPGGGLNSFTALPMAAVIVASLVFVALSDARLDAIGNHARGVGALLLVALAAYAAVRRLTESYVQLVPYVILAAGAVLRGLGSLDAGAAAVWDVLLVLALAGAAGWSALASNNPNNRVISSLGAVAALAAGVVLHGPGGSSLAWVWPSATAALLASMAALVGRRSESPKTDLALAIWIWCAAAAALAALQKISHPSALPVALAFAAAIFAVLHARIGWRGLAASSLAAALASLAAVLEPTMARAVLTHGLGAAPFAVVVALAAAVVFGGAALVRQREPDSEVATALSTGALLIVLAGAFLLLRLWGSGPVGARLDPFVESGMRSLLILAAGLMAATGRRPEGGVISRWRADALLCIGLAHAVLFQVLAYNPLFAGWRPAVAGPPVFDTLLPGYLAPALLLGAAAWRGSPSRTLLRVYAAGALAFGIVWIGMEIRRVFQGPSLHGALDGIARDEAAAYGVLLFAVARGLFEVFRRGPQVGRTLEALGPDMQRPAAASAWLALGLGGLVFLWGASPWWGPIDRPLATQGAAALLFALYALGVAGALSLIGPAEQTGQAQLARAARILAVATAFALLSLLIRWAFQGLDMRPDLREASFQTWTFSAAWGLFGFGLLVFAVVRHESELRWAGLAVLLGTTAKIFLFDMARLEGVVRAGSFLAVGALLLAAAVLARRLSRDGRPPGADPAASEAPT